MSSINTIEENAPLSPLTTFRVGGTARFLMRVHSLDALQEALQYAREHSLRWLLLGGGSNVLFSDEGFDGLVLKIEIGGIEVYNETIIAGAGVEWHTVVLQSVSEGLWGIENLSGIPGTMGAAPVQNIGAYGSELADTLAWVEVYDVLEEKVVQLSREQCHFGYRSSIFKQHPGRYVVLRVALALSSVGAPRLHYKDLQTIQHPSMHNVREHVLAVRKNKFPDLSMEGTAGSFFLNPVVSVERAEALQKQYPDLPLFPVQGGVKVALGWLLDHALHIKGMHEGRARVFERQALVVVAERGCSAREIILLKEKIIERVKNELSIDITPEVQIIF